MTSYGSKLNFKPSFEFKLNLPETRRYELLQGALILKLEPGSAGVLIQATSGCIGNQYQNSWVKKGKGPLPPSGAIAPKKYTVSTQRLWLPHVKGVEGSFYAIAPFEVKVGSLTRGDFGIHFDANVPGSAGCCVIKHQDHWDYFRQVMDDLRSMGHQQVALAVRYGLPATAIATA